MNPRKLVFDSTPPPTPGIYPIQNICKLIGDVPKWSVCVHMRVHYFFFFQVDSGFGFSCLNVTSTDYSKMPLVILNDSLKWNNENDK